VQCDASKTAIGAKDNAQLLRWALQLEDFDFEVVHRAGKLNANADSLSRITIPETRMEDETKSDEISEPAPTPATSESKTDESSDILLITEIELPSRYHLDPEFSEILTALRKHRVLPDKPNFRLGLETGWLRQLESEKS
jgi:hypothetical protein